jgi:hypothetical protein
LWAISDVRQFLLQQEENGMIHVTKSSAILLFAYDDTDYLFGRTTNLYIQFASGSIYRYNDVPFNVIQGLMVAESKGKYVNTEITNAYKFELVTNIPGDHLRMAFNPANIFSEAAIQDAQLAF